jgi:hypothetical protein
MGSRWFGLPIEIEDEQQTIVFRDIRSPSPLLKIYRAILHIRKENTNKILSFMTEFPLSGAPLFPIDL